MPWKYLLINSISLVKKKLFIVDIPTSSIIKNWKLPTDQAARDLTVDEEKIYITLFSLNYIYRFNKEGKELKKLGGEDGKSRKEGSFVHPAGLTKNEKYLYICDCTNQRVQVLEKDDGSYLCQWKEGERPFRSPQSNLLYENILYVGDWKGIQIFDKAGKCMKSFGSEGEGQGKFFNVRSLCIVNESLYIVDYGNKRIQVWN